MSTVIAISTVAALVLVAVTTATRTRRSAMDRPRTGWDVLVHELERARRHERPFVLARLRASPTYDPGALPRRRIDEAWQVGNDLYVLLPETDLAGARQWRERAVTTRPHEGPRAEDLSLAGFPDHGLTTGALLAALDDAAADAPIPVSDAVSQPQLGVEQQAS